MRALRSSHAYPVNCQMTTKLGCVLRTPTHRALPVITPQPDSGVARERRDAGRCSQWLNSEERHARYEKAQIASTRRWNRFILGANIVVAVLMLAATVVMAIATVGIWRDPPKSASPSTATDKASH